VLEAATVVKLMVNEVIRTVGPEKDLKRYAPDRLARVLGSPFASRITDHFAPLLGAQRDVKVSTDPLGLWWRTGYELRTRVSHEGYRPLAPEALEAVQTMEALHDWTGRALARDPIVGKNFHPEFRPHATSHGREPLD